ncbi:DUF4142 domain-containing protein [Roseimaritima sediminicola]|uniref:DUF4142 domain-containing protein n=1 Tax=Roseimaritima sediminicola TaxID=2662066 RepID=UPI0012983093|nr:DUF4142 domain-containing protein [Roseimaritima sediminicola]
MKRLLTCASAALLGGALALPAMGQGVEVEADGTRVEVGGEAGVQVQSDQPRRRPLAPGQRLTPNRPDRADVDVQVRGDAGAAVRPGQPSRHVLVGWLLSDQQATQQLARYGLQHSKTPEVRQLAETVLRDHERLIEQLQAHRDRRPGTVSRSTDPTVARAEANAERRQEVRDEREEVREEIRETREARRDARRAADGVVRPLERLGDRIEDGVERIAEAGQNAAEATREAVDANLGDDARRRGRIAPPDAAAVRLHQQIVRRTAELARQDLDRRQGREFDAAWVGMLEAAHLQQQAALEVAIDHADPELRQVLQDGLATIKQHRQAASRTMENLSRR